MKKGKMITVAMAIALAACSDQESDETVHHDEVGHWETQLVPVEE